MLDCYFQIIQRLETIILPSLEYASPYPHPRLEWGVLLLKSVLDRVDVHERSTTRHVIFTSRLGQEINNRILVPYL